MVAAVIAAVVIVLSEQAYGGQYEAHTSQQ
jgi:hypothetical protein